MQSADHNSSGNQPSPPAAPQLLTIDEACRHLRISRWLLYRLIQQRKLTTVQIGRRRLIPADAIARFINSQTDEGDR
ncbi:hypothetical protein GCM10023321_37800 [Pseudonocardia eucalypti]|uniref:Helix-turn-helix domain-containing protein n=1 Tax=Pseudonocardia eucalypti TaxID=648755 RepID=A0ABP9Q8S1_9PSEU|nr:excisionase family DNA binding protein [Pseudonocardia eucalypti]